MYLVMPIVMAFVVIYGLIKKVSVFEAFTKGAKEGLSTVIAIAPALVGLVVAVSMLKASSLLELLADFLSPVCDALGFPSELVAMSVLRPVSGGGSQALLNQALSDYGADSFLGRCASVIAGSTETTFYVVTMYFGYLKIRKIRHTLVSALLADLTAVIVAVISVSLFF